MFLCKMITMIVLLVVIVNTKYLRWNNSTYDDDDVCYIHNKYTTYDECVLYL